MKNAELAHLVKELKDESDRLMRQKIPVKMVAEAEEFVVRQMNKDPEIEKAFTRYYRARVLQAVFENPGMTLKEASKLVLKAMDKESGVPKKKKK